MDISRVYPYHGHIAMQQNSKENNGLYSFHASFVNLVSFIPTRAHFSHTLKKLNHIKV